ncbi:hypothetical protein BY458DRAFT_510999 [Sporodiniella umbellata]|nr:hypothetical protein BY458DRAFT_510999 [Sporodiniella umbellata]
MKIIYLFVVLLLPLIHALPVIFSSRTTTTEDMTIDITLNDNSENNNRNNNSNKNNVIQNHRPTENECPESEYGIVVEHFSQLVATHWQFDHLDSMMANTYRMIAESFQQHIQITSDKRDYMDDTMDLEILHAQIFGAIQAHTEGSLPLAWDELADKLSKQALEGYIRSKSLEHCTLTGDLVSSTCLRDKAELLATDMEDYIRASLEEIYTTLDDDILPKLLTKTRNDLIHILDYFNRIFFLEESKHLSLNVLPWTHQKESLKLAILPSLTLDNDNHPKNFFSQYVCLSKA